MRPGCVLALVLAALPAAGGCTPGGRATQAKHFVRSETCVPCHAEEAAAWRRSQHALAMQVAADSTVLGDFGGAALTHFGVASRFFRRDGAFFVRTEGADGRDHDFEVRYTFGVEPLQQYLVEFPGGRLQALPVAWDTRSRRWFHLYPDERIGPRDPLHWTGPYLNWNAQCAACHSTRLRKHYDAAADSYATTWSDLNVGCEACHGPGSAHVAWAKRAGGKNREAGDPALAETFADARSQVETCAPCHSRRVQITDDYEPGQPFLDHFVPERLEEGLYYPDGQILDEVYVYGSFAQSRMYAAGVRCSDCHDPHSLRLVASGNALCTRCHGQEPDPRFPTLRAGLYDSPEHHFHTPGTPGSHCVDCHMPTRTYMVVDPRRDHSFKVPRPDLSASLGTPDACSSCHRKPAEWAAREIRKRWAVPTRQPDPETLVARGRSGDPTAAPGLAHLASDTARPAILRATALELLPPQSAEAAAAFEAGLRDSSALVRRSAIIGFEGAPPSRKIEALSPLLTDPRRAVRIEAARVLATVPRDQLEPATQRAFDRSLEEYLESQRIMQDQPSGNMGIALIQEAQGQDDLAERSYLAALQRSPAFLPARFNLSHLYNRAHRNAEAEQVLREGLAWAPKDGELHYSLGLLLAEDRRYEDSERELDQATALLPDRARVAMNHGLVLERLGRAGEALVALERARRLDPGDPDIRAALAALRAPDVRRE